MDIHKNARLTPHSRAELVRRFTLPTETPERGLYIMQGEVSLAGETFSAGSTTLAERPRSKRLSRPASP